MVFTNSIMIIHVNKIANLPPMSSMVVRGYRSVDATNPRGGYQELFIIVAPILDDKNGHYVKPSRVALKYLDFKKDVDLNANVRVLNFAVKTNVETSKKYIINDFSYTLRDTTSN